MPHRRNILKAARHVVIKLGSQLLTDKANQLDAAFVGTVAAQVARLRTAGVRVTIVSSGAVACGLTLLNLSKRPRDLAALQAIAAVGQRRLMDAWADAFEPYSVPVATVLLTREDIDDRTRFLNLRNTVNAIHRLNAVPIINENDTISTDELVRITFGDNDILAALVCQALRADLLLLMSVVDGVLDADGGPLRTVTKIEDAEKLLRSEKSALGKGGMNSKLIAARMVTRAGEAMVLADGRTPELLTRVLAGEEIGSFFVPQAGKQSGRSRWISSVRPAGTIYVDDGAAVAVAEKNRSLLPAGVTRVEGNFARGDVVSIVTADGKPVARGLSNYASPDAAMLCGKKTSELRQMLGARAYEEIVHRDNLVII